MIGYAILLAMLACAAIAVLVALSLNDDPRPGEPAAETNDDRREAAPPEVADGEPARTRTPSTLGVRRPR